MGACYCLGPRPGHTLCPCRERAEAAHRGSLTAPFQARIDDLEEENRRLRAELEVVKARHRPPSKGWFG